MLAMCEASASLSEERWVSQKVNIKEMQTVQGSHSFQFSPQTSPVALNSHCVLWASVWRWCCLLSWPSLFLNLVTSNFRNPEQMTAPSVLNRSQVTSRQSLWHGMPLCSSLIRAPQWDSAAPLCPGIQRNTQWENFKTRILRSYEIFLDIVIRLSPSANL